jgi:hypothetical protein
VVAANAAEESLVEGVLGCEESLGAHHVVYFLHCHLRLAFFARNSQKSAPEYTCIKSLEVKKVLRICKF